MNVPLGGDWFMFSEATGRSEKNRNDVDGPLMGCCGLFKCCF